jgi:hypothetical protein
MELMIESVAALIVDTVDIQYLYTATVSIGDDDE